MAKGKSQNFTWVCTETGAYNYHSTGNKRAGNVPTTQKKYSKGVRKVTVHKRIDTKKGN